MATMKTVFRLSIFTVVMIVATGIILRGLQPPPPISDEFRIEFQKAYKAIDRCDISYNTTACWLEAERLLDALDPQTPFERNLEQVLFNYRNASRNLDIKNTPKNLMLYDHAL